MIQVLFIDLDNFKNVNDSIGHAKGDELLKQVAGRLLSVTRVSDTVSRLGGDEFIIMVPNINNMMEIIFMVERVQEELTHPFSLGDHTFHISCSIGVCVYPNDGSDAETLIRNADLAMYQSKNSGKDKYHLFEVQMAQKVRERVEMEASLHTALENNEFQVYFQPQVNNQTLLPVGIEALVRWVKPDGTIIPPGQFIPLAEESGLIVPLGEQIFRSALVHANDICIHTGMNLSVAVNVSARQFDDNYFEEMVSKALADTGFPANRLKIEITESLLIKENDIAMTRLKRLSEIGILTEIDDFGTGYSSLAYIKKLPISTLKIDKSFIDGIPNDPDDIALVETIVLMANKLKIGIVAEGVETPEQLQALRLLGDMDIQGYLFARPMPPEQIKTWILKKIAET